MDNPEQLGLTPPEEEQAMLPPAEEAGIMQQQTMETRYGGSSQHGGGGGGNTAGASRQASMSNIMAFSKVPVARKEEVQKLLGQCLVLKCDPNGPYLAPIVVMSADENNIYSWLENHLRPEYLMGAERFWKLVRSDMAIDTWRPRVQGQQLKALVGARLPESPDELAQVEATILTLQDCLKPDTTPELMVTDLRHMIFQIQTWWENRNKRPDGGTKRPNGGGSGAPAKKDKRASGGPQIPDMGMTNMMSPGYMDMMDQGGMMRDQSDPWGWGGRQMSHLAASGSGQGIGSMVFLDVGGVSYKTSVGTLLAVQHSYFWNMLHSTDPASMPQRLSNGDIFIDRNGDIFNYVLEYLRSCANGEPTFPLPNDAKELQALAREALFYQLPGLVDHIQAISIMPQPGTRTYYDSLYLETGFKSIEGPSLKEMEKCKVVVMQQMNHVLSLRAQDGFYVDQFKCGVNHRVDSKEGCMQHNLYYNILLKKVVPLLPRRVASAMRNDGGGPRYVQ